MKQLFDNQNARLMEYQPNLYGRQYFIFNLDHINLVPYLSVKYVGDDSLDETAFELMDIHTEYQHIQRMFPFNIK